MKLNMNAHRDLRDNCGENRWLGSEVAASLDAISTRQVDLEKKTRVLVVDDHPFVRVGIVKLINRQQDLMCCGEADNTASALLLIAKQKPQLLLLDLRLKDGEAFELIDRIRSESPRIAILVLSQGDEAIYAERVLRVGANGYIMKQEAAAELLTAIRTVLRGKTYVSPIMTERLKNRASPSL